MPTLTRFAPVLEFLKIGENSDPQVHEDEMGFAPYFGHAIDAPILCLTICWEFRTHDILSGEQFCLNASVQQGHHFPKNFTVPLHVVKDIILISYNESRQLYHSNLREKGIRHQVPDLPDDRVNECADVLFQELNENLNNENKDGQ